MSKPDRTAAPGSLKWNIPPSPSHRIGLPPRRREMSSTREARLVAICAATSSPRSSVSLV
jgi:hypothetical protein